MSGDANQIYRQIQYSADIAHDELSKTQNLEDFDQTLGDEIKNSIHESLECAGELRSFLNTTNNKIKRERRLNHTLRNMIKPSENDYGIFFEQCLIYLTEEFHTISNNVRKSLETIREFINMSIGFRIQLIACWDEILTCHQELVAEQIVALSHRLSELAILLQEENAIEHVRNLLESLNIKIHDKVRHEDLPESTEELRMLFEEDLQNLQTSGNQLNYLRAQHHELRLVQSELYNQYKYIKSQDAPLPINQPSKSNKPEKQHKRMAYHTHKKSSIKKSPK